MIRRQVNILKTNSFFLFGARGVGKTKLIVNTGDKARIFTGEAPAVNAGLLVGEGRAQVPAVLAPRAS
jgi:hypothetical protein